MKRTKRQSMTHYLNHSHCVSMIPMLGVLGLGYAAASGSFIVRKAA